MSNYREFHDRIAFHPGYYLKELVEDSGLTQEDFAKRLGTTPKNLSILIRGEQSLSIDIASKLSRMYGTTVGYWLNLQRSYDEKIADFLSEEELKREREVFKLIDYRYFIDNFGFPDLAGRIDDRIKTVREYLSIASLTVLEDQNLIINFRKKPEKVTASNIVNANVMLQIALNRTLKTEASKFNKKKFEKAVSFALTQTRNQGNFLPLVSDAFKEAGVILMVLPEMKQSKVSGAAKKADGKVLLLVNGQEFYIDTFWVALFHEISRILRGDMGITSEDEEIDPFAWENLVPSDRYERFIRYRQVFDEYAIRTFAESIDRDPGIILEKLRKDRKISRMNSELSKKLRRKYDYVIAPEFRIK